MLLFKRATKREQAAEDLAHGRFVSALCGSIFEHVDKPNAVIAEEGLATIDDSTRIGRETSPERAAVLQGSVARVLAPLRAAVS